MWLKNKSFLCLVQRIRFIVMKVKVLDLHLDAKSYIEGLGIIFNIVTNQYVPHLIQSSV